MLASTLSDCPELRMAQVEPSRPILLGNGATNWSPQEVLVLQQVRAPP